MKYKLKCDRPCGWICKNCGTAVIIVDDYHKYFAVASLQNTICFILPAADGTEQVVQCLWRDADNPVHGCMVFRRACPTCHNAYLIYVSDIIASKLDRL